MNLKQQKVNLTLVVIFLHGFYFIKCFAQAPSWNWAKRVTGDKYEFVNSLTTDDSGNVYMTGYFEGGSITFDNITLNNLNSGNPDMYIAKYNANGDVLWAKSAGGTAWDEAYSITLDNNGDLYVTGRFSSSSISFDSSSLSNPFVGFMNTFIVKYDVNGNAIWAKSYGGSKGDEASSVTTDANGNILSAGYFDSPSISFDSIVLTNSSNSSDFFIVKYDINGNVLWAHSAGGTNSDNIKSITTDDLNNIYVVGWFNSSSIIFSTDTIINAGSNDIFIAKYSSDGNFLWAKSISGAGNDYAFSISTDVSGNPYIAGSFGSSSITFGSSALSNSGGGSRDMLIAKYDADGNELWGRSAGGTDYEAAYSITADTMDNIYVVGSFQSSSVSFGSNTLLKVGSRDIFVVKYDADGNALWAKGAGGGDSEEAYSVAIDDWGNIFTAGYFSSTPMTFGSILINNSAPPYDDIFLAKLGNISGINNANNIESISIFPNPFNSEININMNAETNALLGISLKNVLGQTVFSEIKDLEIGTQKIQIINPKSLYLHPGMYLLELNFKGAKQYSKLIYQK